MHLSDPDGTSSLSTSKVVNGLKGLAILLVLLYHCFPALYKVGTGLCWIGVDLYLVLLGFAATDFLLKSKEKPGSIALFFSDVTLLLLILYYFLLTLFFIVFPFCTSLEWISNYLAYYDHQVWYWLGLSNWLVTFQNHWPAVTKPILDHTWLFSLEIQFFLFWPFVVLLFRRKHLLYICLFLILQSLLLRNVFENEGLNYAASYVFTFGRMDGICLGALIALLIQEEKHKKRLVKYAPYVIYGSLACLVLIIGLSKSLSLKHPYFIRIGYTVLAFLFSSVLILSLSERTWWSKLAKNKVLSWFGKYSESIYLVHWFLYILMADFLNQIFHIIASPLLASLASSFASIFGILLSAFITWQIAFYLTERLRKPSL